jgi:DNA-binding IclR family transcriptional regulator
MIGLNTEQSDSQRIIAEILSVLRENSGEQMSPYIMARKIGQALASTRQTMAELASTGIIRRAGTRSATAYYMPTVAQLAAEARSMESNWRPLRPRLEHRAKIEEVRALRDAIPSVV